MTLQDALRSHINRTTHVTTLEDPITFPVFVYLRRPDNLSHRLLLYGVRKPRCSDRIPDSKSAGQPESARQHSENPGDSINDHSDGMSRIDMTEALTRQFQKSMARKTTITTACETKGLRQHNATSCRDTDRNNVVVWKETAQYVCCEGENSEEV